MTQVRITLMDLTSAAKPDLISKLPQLSRRLLSRLGKAQRAQHCTLGGWAVGHTSFCPTYNC